MAKLFGTDGVRGVANTELTPETALNLGRAAAALLRKDGERPVFVVGKDTRISGDLLEAGLCAGLCSAGAEVWHLGVVPTPAVAWLARELGAVAGVVISASHNPMADNGIKFIGGNGYKLSDDLERRLEQAALGDPGSLPRPGGKDVGRIFDRTGEITRYLEHVKATATKTSLQGLKIVVDCANGAASDFTPKLLQELGADVVPLFNHPDGTNINHQCGSTHLETLRRQVPALRADLGLAHDGDADRLLAVDEEGNIVDGDQIMVACALELKKQLALAQNSVVATVMSNLGLFKTLEAAGINVVTTRVGDRYVLEELLRTGTVLGGEQSGHIIFLEHNTTGDGLITALQLLKVMVESQRSLKELGALMPKYPQLLQNIPVTDKEHWQENRALVEAINRAEERLGNRGRVLVRPSGTEPLLRIMLEGPDLDELQSLMAELIGTISA